MMSRFLLLGLLAGCVACASAQKNEVATEKPVDPRVAALEPFLDDLEADEDAAEEEGRAARRLLSSR